MNEQQYIILQELNMHLQLKGDLIGALILFRFVLASDVVQEAIKEIVVAEKQK